MAWKKEGECPRCGNPIYTRGRGDELPEVRRTCYHSDWPTNIVVNPIVQPIYVYEKRYYWPYQYPQITWGGNWPINTTGGQSWGTGNLLTTNNVNTFLNAR